jgi:hypothetical protein
MFQLCGESVKLSYIDLTCIDKAKPHVIVDLMQNHGTIGSRSRFTGKPESRSRLEFYVYVFAMQETDRSNPPPSWPGIGQVARPCISQDVCRSFAGRCPRDQGPLAVLGASRLFVLLVAARRWVLTGNTSLLGLSPLRFATLGMFCNPSSGDLRPFSRRDTHSGFDKVRIASPRPKDQSILIFLLLLPETSYFHTLPLLLVGNPRLPDFAFLGYPCCGVISSVDFWWASFFVVIRVLCWNYALEAIIKMLLL